MKLPSRVPISPRAALVVGVLFMSWSAIFIKLATAPVLIIAFYRMFFAVALLTPEMALRRMPRLRRRDLLLMLASGVLLAVHFVAWIAALKRTNVAVAVVLVNTHPLFVAILAWLFLGEKLTSKAIFWMFLTVLATAALSVGDFAAGESQVRGNLLAIAGAVLVSGYLIIGRLLRRGISARIYVYVVYTTSAFTLLGACLVTGAPLFGHPGSDYLWFLGLAIFPTLLGHSVFNWALGHVKTSVVATAILGEPVFATVLSLIILREQPGVATIVVGPLLLYAIYRFVRAETPETPQAYLDTPS
jgi:drug/metabolite transporter (DMT)-like permease